MPGYRFSVEEDGLVTELNARVDLERPADVEREATEMLAQMMLDGVRQWEGPRSLRVTVRDWTSGIVILTARLELSVQAA